MKYEITKSFTFEAAHSLPHLPLHHKCRRVHGHCYGLVVGVKGEINEGEWLMDYADLSAIVAPLVHRLDHHNLNELLPYATTAENLARWFWEKLIGDIPILSRIEIRETPTTNVILTA